MRVNRFTKRGHSLVQ